jgi:hypothetical protein
LPIDNDPRSVFERLERDRGMLDVLTDQVARLAVSLGPGDRAKLARLHKVNAYHVDQFAHLVNKLAALSEGDGKMLDHSVFLYGTSTSESKFPLVR